MQIIEYREIVYTPHDERRQIIVDSIVELEEQHTTGHIEEHAYWLKKRALIKLLK